MLFLFKIRPRGKHSAFSIFFFYAIRLADLCLFLFFSRIHKRHYKQKGKLQAMLQGIITSIWDMIIIKCYHTDDHQWYIIDYLERQVTASHKQYLWCCKTQKEAYSVHGDRDQFLLISMLKMQTGDRILDVKTYLNTLCTIKQQWANRHRNTQTYNIIRIHEKEAAFINRRKSGIFDGLWRIILSSSNSLLVYNRDVVFYSTKVLKLQQKLMHKSSSSYRLPTCHEFSLPSHQQLHNDFCPLSLWMSLDCLAVVAWSPYLGQKLS